jgi:hypothetical protein
MRWLMQQLKQHHAHEHGAVAILLAISLVVLIGATAFTVDFGTMHLQRRQYQNSADAGALAIAQDCARGTCPANENARAAQYTSLNEAANRDPGNFGPSTSVAEYPDAGLVRVTVSGDNSPIFRGVLGQQESPISATAVAGWGRPRALAPIIPVTISICEFEYYVGNPPSNFADWPPYDAGFPASSLEANTIIKSPKWQETGITCERGPAGQVAAGSWGWLNVSGDCISEVNIDGWVQTDTGGNIPNSPGFPQACRNRIQDSIGEVAYLPIYDAVARNEDGTGTPTGDNNWYRIEGYAPLFLTGFNANPVKIPSIATGATCAANELCFQGFFLEGGLIPREQIPSGTELDLGVIADGVAVRLLE